MIGDPEALRWESSLLLDPASQDMEDLGSFPLPWIAVRHQKCGPQF